MKIIFHTSRWSVCIWKCTYWNDQCKELLLLFPFKNYLAQIVIDPRRVFTTLLRGNLLQSTCVCPHSSSCSVTEYNQFGHARVGIVKKMGNKQCWLLSFIGLEANIFFPLFSQEQRWRPLLPASSSLPFLRWI